MLKEEEKRKRNKLIYQSNENTHTHRDEKKTINVTHPKAKEKTSVQIKIIQKKQFSITSKNP